MNATRISTAFSSSDDYLRQPIAGLVEVLFAEVSDFDIDQCTLCFGVRCVFAQMGAANPASCRVLTVLIEKNTPNHEHLFSTPMFVRIKKCSGRPSNQRDVLTLVLMQAQNREAWYQPRRPLGRVGICDDLSLIVHGELVQFDQDNATLVADLWRVRRAYWISYIGSGRIGMMFIAEFTFEYEELFSAGVHVLGKYTSWCVTDQRRRSGHIIAQ